MYPKSSSRLLLQSVYSLVGKGSFGVVERTAASATVCNPKAIYGGDPSTHNRPKAAPEQAFEMFQSRRACSDLRRGTTLGYQGFNKE